jgi:transcriptional regulator with XRE-family HTH domain
MASKTEDATPLACALTKRMEQLGMSRREFERKSGLSRQTLFKIENNQHVKLEPRTLALLDEFLKWVPGTALALSQGDASAVNDADILTRADREKAYRWSIVERLTNMSLEDLETLVAVMEQRALGQAAESATQHVELVTAQLDRMMVEG